jgi:hypothetical protein
MCFDTHLSAATRRVALLLLFATAVTFAGCGKKGDPLPPLRDIPLKTADLALRQQGNLILFEMAYPSVTIAGLPLGGIEGVELFQLIKPAPEGVAPVADPLEVEGQAEVLLTLRGAELGAAIIGDRIQFRIPLQEELPEEPAAHVFSVRTLKADEVSDFSNLVTLVPRQPPEAPANLRVTAGQEAIELSWESSETMQGFAVYRRGAAERGYGNPVQQLASDARSYTDSDVEYGQRYIYTVRALASVTPPILSAEAGEREIDYVDRFPPEVPGSFVALGERVRVRLRWEASDAEDIAGYILYRRERGREFHRLVEELIQSSEHIDRGLVAGFSYDYRIQAVDMVGNESALSETATAEVR